MMMKQRVLILSNHALGLYNFRKELMSELCRRYEVHVSCPDHELVKDILALGCTWHRTPIDRRGMNIIKDGKLYMTYRKLLKNNNPDVVMTYTIKPNVYGGIACKGKKIPVIASITGLGTSFQNKGSLVYRLVSFLYKRGLSKAKAVFFQNTYNLNIMRELDVIQQEVTRLVNGSGVNLDDYPFYERPNNQKTRILFISRLMKEKGIIEFLDAVESIGTKNGNVEYGLLGFYEEEAIKARIESMEKEGLVQHMGVSYDMNKVYRNADLVVLPSYHEGMSNVLQEAAATGLPTITTDIPGCHEIVEDGVTGYLCKLKDVDSLESAMRSFIDLSYDERLIMGKKARGKMEREFDRKLIVKSYLDEIKSVIG